MSNHETFMARALDLAEKGRYSVSPNPMVGCVIVRGSEIVGEGYHERAGEPHAEIHALREAGDNARGATVYVSLEPCSHDGRTPPCSDALVAAGVERVVVATIDPNPAVAGRGLARLRDAGIEVVEGVLEPRALALNEAFLFSAAHDRPFVIAKAGMSLDGKLATSGGQSQWITCEESRERSLALREECDAILVGSGTIAADDPRLSRRLGWNTSILPFLRIVVDADGAIPPRSIVMTDGHPTLVVTTRRGLYAPTDSVEIVEIEERNGMVDLEQVFHTLHEREIRSVLVEGGSRVLSSLISAGGWQKMILFVAPTFLGGAHAPAILSSGFAELTDAPRFRFDQVETIGTDVMITAYPIG